MKESPDIIDGARISTYEELHSIGEHPSTSHYRIVKLNDPQAQKFCNNSISTAKYNAFTFLPKFLIEQFRRYSNIFFLLVAILQQIPNVSPTGRYTTLVPLMVILAVSALKELVEDFKRHRADDATNNSRVLVLRDGGWHEIQWKELQVGDIVKVLDKQQVPADLVLIATSEPQAMCYIETSNLDGETNLKLRQGLHITAHYQSLHELMELKGHVDCQLPNRHLYEFMGNFCLPGSSSHPIGNEQLLLRGSSLKNTRWVFGVVVYTGHETKVMLNSTSAPLKRSMLEKQTNRNVLFLFGTLAFLTTFVAAASTIWVTGNLEKAWYLGYSTTPLRNFGSMLLTAFVMFHTVIPISLQVSLELVRFVQAFFINWDIEMYDENSDTPALARTSNLNEELGQVKYVFSDKTGTLTKNVMDFQRCSIGGHVYGAEGVDFTSQPHGDLEIKLDEGEPLVDMFFTMLAICHTVVPERDPDNPQDIQYQASSPDENALVKAASFMKYVFTTRTPDGVTIVARGKERFYKLLNVIEFTSDRKRMSVVVEDPSGKIRVFVKGADSVIFERLHKSSLYQEETSQNLLEFARFGLRTLCFAYADVEPSFYEEWRQKMHAACTSMTDRDAKIAKVAEAIEKNLFLLGASAIEDKLQDGVPETIASLMKADIKVWMLTGDKQETAINIGTSCNLITSSMLVVPLSCETLDDTRAALQVKLGEFGDRLGHVNDVALVIEGHTLKHALNGDCRREFLQVASSCSAVICCRVSPLQKAEVVGLIRENHPGIVTLAIGDGANDVGMIQAAHVGVGISGMEGLQAACASDYSIAQFRFLKKLLLVHGAWNYQRLAKLILYSFYKNICLYLMLLWYSIVSGFSGQVIFERWSMGFFNLLFSNAPPLVLGMFDRSCSSRSRMEHPQLYKESQESCHYNWKIFFGWMLNSVYHSAVIFWLSFASNNDVPFANGQSGDMLVLGLRIYTYVVVTVAFKAGLEHRAWTWLTHASIWGSIFLWVFFVIVYSHIWPIRFASSADMSGMDSALFSSALFWFGLLLIPIIALTRDVVWKAISRTFFPCLRDQLIQCEALHLDPANIIFADARTPIAKGSRLIKVFGRSANPLYPFRTVTSTRAPSGYAFSQEERGAVRQSDIVRVYDTTVEKPSGN